MKLWIATGIVMAAAIAYGVPALSQGPSLPPGEYDLEAGRYVFNVPELQATDTPLSPTNTPVPPTSTSVPPTVTAEPSGHLDRVWHPLTEEFAHEHKQNPHALDGLLGTQLWSWTGGDISYPWETPNENLNKHEGYGWLVRQNIPIDNDTVYGQRPGSVRNYRFGYHAINSSVGAVTRLHSFVFDSELCWKPTNQCGPFFTAGWLDWGNLFSDDRVHVPLPGDNPNANNITNGRGARIHNRGPNAGSIWYSNSKGADDTANDFISFLLVLSDAWGPINPADPNELILDCPDFQCEWNNSQVRVLQVDVDLEVFVPELNGLIEFSGFTDRYGAVVSGCTSVSLDCVPLEIHGIPPERYIFTWDGQGENFIYDGDTSPPGEFWIAHPN